MTQQICVVVASLLVIQAGVLVAAWLPDLPPFSTYDNDNSADLSNLDATLLQTNLPAWIEPVMPTGTDNTNLPAFLPVGYDALPGQNTSTAVLSTTGNCIVDGLATNGLTSFLKALNVSGLNTTFRGLTSVTFLVPSNDAFAAWTSSMVSSATLEATLWYHVIPAVYGRRQLAALNAPMPTRLLADKVSSSCPNGNGKTTISVDVASNFLILEGAASSARLIKEDITLCDGAVNVQVINQVLQPCCLEVAPLLQGGSNRRPVLVNTTEAMVVAFQDHLTIDATAKVSPAQTVLVPTEAAWASVNWAAVMGNTNASLLTAAEKDALLQSVALYHVSAQPLTLATLSNAAVNSIKGTLTSVLGTAANSSSWSCQQKLRYQYKSASGSIPATFAITSDDLQTSANIVGYYQTCSGVSVYQLDAVLLPCDLLKTAGLTAKTAATVTDDDDVNVVLPLPTVAIKNGAAGAAGVVSSAVLGLLMAVAIL